MTREEKLQTLKYVIYGLVMLLAFVLCSARGITPQLWGAALRPLPFLVCAIALYEGPYVGAGFGVGAGLLAGLHSMIVEGLSCLYLGLFGLVFGLLAMIWLRQLLLNAVLGGLLCILLQGAARYVFYQRLAYGIPLSQGALQLAGEVLLAILPGVLLCLLVKQIHGKFQEVQAQ